MPQSRVANLSASGGASRSIQEILLAYLQAAASVAAWPGGRRADH